MSAALWNFQGVEVMTASRRIGVHRMLEGPLKQVGDRCGASTASA